MSLDEIQEEVENGSGRTTSIDKQPKQAFPVRRTVSSNSPVVPNFQGTKPFKGSFKKVNLEDLKKSTFNNLKKPKTKKKKLAKRNTVGPVRLGSHFTDNKEIDIIEYSIYSNEDNYLSSPSRKKAKKKPKNKPRKSKVFKSVSNLDSQSNVSGDNLQSQKDFLTKSNPGLKTKKPKKKKKKLTKKERKKLKKIKRLKLKKLREKKRRQKKLRMKKKFKKMLAKFLKDNPWKNKNMFKGRQEALKQFRRRGTLPGIRLAQKKEKTACNRHNQDHFPVLKDAPLVRRNTLLDRGTAMYNSREPVFNGKEY